MITGVIKSEEEVYSTHLRLVEYSQVTISLVLRLINKERFKINQIEEKGKFGVLETFRLFLLF